MRDVEKEIVQVEQLGREWYYWWGSLGVEVGEKNNSLNFSDFVKVYVK